MTPVIEQPITIQNPITKTSLLKGFLNFNEFIGARLVKIIYVVGFVLIVLGIMGGVLLSSAGLLYKAIDTYRSFEVFVTVLVSIVFYLIGAIVLSVLGILLLRLYCEFLLTIFKINENIQGLRNKN